MEINKFFRARLSRRVTHGNFIGNGAFTFVEVLFVVLIIAAIVMMAIPEARNQMVESRAAAETENLRMIQAAKLAWMKDYPGQELPGDVEEAKAAISVYLPYGWPESPWGVEYEGVNDINVAVSSPVNGDPHYEPRGDGDLVSNGFNDLGLSKNVYLVAPNVEGTLANWTGGTGFETLAPPPIVVDEWALTLVPTPGGSGVLTGSGVYAVGDSATYTAAPIDNTWRFVQWQNDLAGLPQNGVYASPDGTDRLGTAVFERILHSLTVTADPPAGGTVTGSGDYVIFSNANAGASANPGWTFSGWSGDTDGATPSGDDSGGILSQIVIDGDKSVVAHFSEALGDLTVRKLIKNNSFGIPPPATFNLTLTGPSGYSEAIVSDESGGSVVLTDLVAGQYTLSEGSLPEGWVSSGPVVLTLGAGASETMELTNTYTPGLELGKVADSATKPVGSSGVFTLTLTNPGTVASESVTMEDVLPAGMSAVSASLASGPGAVSLSGNTVSWSGVLDGGESAVVEVSYTMDTVGLKVNTVTSGSLSASASVEGLVQNWDLEVLVSPDVAATPVGAGTFEHGDNVTFSFSGKGAEYDFIGWSGDSTSMNVSDSLTLDGNKSVTANFVRVQKTATPASVELGGSGIFTVSVGNSSSINSGVKTMVDTLPAGLTATGASVTSGPGEVSLAGNTVTWTGSLSPGQFSSISIPYTMNSEGDHVNTAVVGTGSSSVSVEGDVPTYSLTLIANYYDFDSNWLRQETLSVTEHEPGVMASFTFPPAPSGGWFNNWSSYAENPNTGEWVWDEGSSSTGSVEMFSDRIVYGEYFTPPDEVTIDVRVSPVEAGTATIGTEGATSMTVDYNSGTLPIATTPASTDWVFQYWSSLQGFYSTDPNAVVDTFFSDTITAYYSAPPVTMTINVIPPEAESYVEGRGEHTAGVTRNVYVDLLSGWQIARIEGDVPPTQAQKDERVGMNDTFYYSTLMDVDKTMTVYATPLPVNLTVQVSPSGAATPVGSGSYEKDTEVSYSFTNKGESYGFIGWDRDTNSTLETDTILMDGHKTVRANFVRVRKTSIPAVVGVLGSGVFRVTVSNSSYLNSGEISMVDTLPDGTTATGVTLVYGPGAVTLSGNTVTWTGSLNRNKRAVIDIAYTMDTLGVKSNTAEFEGGSATSTVEGQGTDLSVSKMSMVDYYDYSTGGGGGPFQLHSGVEGSYMVTIVNNGPMPATNVVFSDILPPEVEPTYPDNISWSFVNWGSEPVTYDPVTREVRMEIPSLPSGSSRTVVMNVTVGALATATNITNTATVTFPGVDPDLSNNSSTVVDSAFPDGPDLQVTKTFDSFQKADGSNPTVMVPGDFAWFRIVLTNMGTSATGPFDVEDLFPVGSVWLGTNNSNVTYPTGYLYYTPDSIYNEWVVGGGNMTNTYQNLEPGESIFFTVGLELPDVGIHTNTASATLHGDLDPSSGLPQDVNPANNISTADAEVFAPDVDLSVTKTLEGWASPRSWTGGEAGEGYSGYVNYLNMNRGITPAVGDFLQYRVDITNNGNVGATDISFEDILPEGMAFVATDIPSAYSVTDDVLSGVYAIRPSDSFRFWIYPGNTQTFNIWAKVLTPGVKVNTWRADHPDDSDISNNEVTYTHEIEANPQVDLFVEKEAIPTEVIAGGIAKFVVTVSQREVNGGYALVHDPLIVDTLPPGATVHEVRMIQTPALGTTPFHTAWGSLPATDVLDWSVGGTTVTWSADYAIFERPLIFEVMVKLPDGYAGDFTNTVVASSTTPEADPSDNVADATVTAFSPTLDLAVEKTGFVLEEDGVFVGAVAAGTSYRYSLRVFNSGSLPIHGFEVVDELPAGVTLVGVTDSTGSSVPYNLSETTLTLSSTALLEPSRFSPYYGTIPENTDPTGIPFEVYYVDVVLDTLGLKTNVAVVSTTEPEDDYSNNTSNWSVMVAEDPDITVTKTVSPTIVKNNPGSIRNANYTIVVTNTGEVPAYDVVITDAPPAGMDYFSLTGVNWSGISASGSDSSSGGVLTYTVPVFPPGSSLILDYSMRANVDEPVPPEGVFLENTVTVTTSSDDPDLSNNTDTAVLHVIPNIVDIGVSKTTLPPSDVDSSRAWFISPGEEYSYRLYVFNNTGEHPSNAVDNPDRVVLEDYLPEEVEFISYSIASRYGVDLDDITVSFDSGTRLLRVVADDFRSGSYFSVQVNVKADEEITVPSITNQAQVWGFLVKDRDAEDPEDMIPGQPGYPGTPADPETRYEMVQDSVPENNISEVTDLVLNEVDLSIIKSVSDPVVATETETSWTVSVTNDYFTTARNVLIEDELPSGYTNWSVSGSVGGSISGGSFVATVDRLMPGETRSWTLTCDTPAVGGQYSNTAVCSTRGPLVSGVYVNPPTEITPSNNSSTVEQYVTEDGALLSGLAGLVAFGDGYSGSKTITKYGDFASYPAGQPKPDVDLDVFTTYERKDENIVDGKVAVKSDIIYTSVPGTGWVYYNINVSGSWSRTSKTVYSRFDPDEGIKDVLHPGEFSEFLAPSFSASVSGEEKTEGGSRGSGKSNAISIFKYSIGATDSGFFTDISYSYYENGRLNRYRNWSITEDFITYPNIYYGVPFYSRYTEVSDPPPYGSPWEVRISNETRVGMASHFSSSGSTTSSTNVDSSHIITITETWGDWYSTRELVTELEKKFWNPGVTSGSTGHLRAYSSVTQDGWRADSYYEAVDVEVDTAIIPEGKKIEIYWTPINTYTDVFFNKDRRMTHSELNSSRGNEEVLATFIRGGSGNATISLDGYNTTSFLGKRDSSSFTIRIGLYGQLRWRLVDQ